MDRRPACAARPPALPAAARRLAGGAALCLLAGCAPPGFPEDPLFSDLGDLEVQQLDPIDPVVETAPDETATEEARDAVLESGEDLRRRARRLRRQEV